MAKKLIYNYTFTPGTGAGTGTIEIEGNYPAKTWQLVTDVGTNGLYPHTFVRDEYAGSTGAIEITGGGSGDLVVSTTGTTFDEDTGIMTVTTTTSHGLSTGATIQFRALGVTFTCAKDDYATEHSYPRTTDPAYGQDLSITVTDADTFTVDVGRLSGGAISSNNEIIYNFADSTKGGSTYYNRVTNVTTLTLKHDTSHLDPLDDLQIFVDITEDKIDFSETFVDPVSKLRVSNPQNLIDTDFEYGLQPTKWETMELVNNIPSFYASSSDYSITDVSSVTATNGSDNITVSTIEAHGLTVGAPIDVQGLSSRTAEGKFLVTAVIDANTFVYKAKTVQAANATISGSYTVITPGQFYQGSNIDINEDVGVETNGANPSTLRVETSYAHGFEAGSSVYVTNTIGSEKYTLEQTTTDTAPDGRPYVDHVDTLSVTLTPDLTQTETKQMTGTYAHKFSSSAVNTADNTITWTNHQLQAGDVLLYIPPSGDTHIGGLQRFQIYYVKSAPSANTITLCETTNGNYTGNATISFTSQGTSNYGRHQLILGYELWYAYSNANDYNSYLFTRRYWSGSGSGRDLYTYSVASNFSRGGYWGLGGKYPERTMYVQKNQSTNMSSIIVGTPMYSTRDNTNFTFNKSGTTPDGYDFIEDFNRYENYGYQNNKYNYLYSSPGYWRHLFVNQFQYNQQASQTNSNWGSGTTFCFWLLNDSESDSLYIQNHELESGSTATFTTNSGSNISYQTSSTFFGTSPSFSTLASGATDTIRVLSENRIKLTSYSRINAATGNYTVTGQRQNPTANSFYLGPNNLIQGKNVVFSTDGGSLPSTTSGPATPTVNSISTVYKKCVDALNNIKSTMGSDHTTIFYTGSTHYYPLTSSNVFFDNGRQYWYMTYNQFYNTKAGSSVNVSSQNFRTGQPFDIWSSTSIGGLGYYVQMTPFETQTNTDYILEVYQRPSDTGTTQWYQSSWGSYHYGLSGTLGNENNNYQNWTSLGNGWRYNYESNYFAPNSTYHGLMCLTLIIDNSNWPNYYATPSSNIYYPNNRYLIPYNFNSYGTSYEVKVWVQIKAGTTSSNYGVSGSTLTTAQMANTIATQISSGLTNPTFSSPTTTAVLTKPTGNRIRLQTSNDTVFNLTNSGTSPFLFQTEELTGALDGYYNIDSKTETTITSFSNAEIPQRVISVGSTQIQEIDGTVYINVNNHKLLSQQKVVYTGEGISGLTSSSTYYAVSDGPNHFRLAASALNAESGNAIGIGTTTSGTQTITVPSISGLSAGDGSVAITSTSTIITGTDSLFKRFFKEGDEFTISNSTTTPPSFLRFNVVSVIDDTELTVDNIPGVEIPSASYYVPTKIYTRPDGAFLHRPFDGGVEINAGTSPNSSIVRQTRKYFRYQSGKGIQCSVAINFNPSRVANALVSSASTSLPAESYQVFVNNNDSSSYNLSGSDRNVTVFGQNPEVALAEGDTIEFVVNSPGHPFWIKTAAVTGTGSSVTTGITNNGTDSGKILWNTSGISTGTYYYQCENHSTMFGKIELEPAGITTTIAKLTTKYPHGITRANAITVSGSSDNAYNGTFDVKASDDFTISYYLPSVPNSGIPDGIVEYNIDGWSNSAVRCGLFDYQNGFFYEFDGQTLYAVRRSSVQQLPGTCRATKGSNVIIGNDTNFTGQLSVGGFVVIRGSSYRITKVVSRTEINIQPAYKGVSSSDAIITKTVDTKVPQTEWNIDKADGSGPSGFDLDITKIQMVYLDYSWYGAGKIRFGFKDTYGHVKYMHEFRHNNILKEAYMRSGNIPARYEIENFDRPSYVPSLFHWGTSVIMDGKFDDDKAYLFTAASNNLIFTNGDSSTATTTGASSITYLYDYSAREFNFYVRIPFNTNDASKFSAGTPLYTADGALNGDLVDYTDYSGGNFNVYIYQSSSRRYNPPAVYPIINSGTSISVGAPSAGGGSIDLNSDVPLISIRLAPSVDNGLTGALGQREIINRMQLQLKSLGITVSHDCTVDVILNGAISNQTYENVTSPSLSELVKHIAGDKVIGGTTIFSLRSSGGTENAAGKRLSSTTDFDLSQITDLGNAILGGDGTFPNGPDLLTIAIKPTDTSEINATTPLTVSSRITWTESQA